MMSVIESAPECITCMFPTAIKKRFFGSLEVTNNQYVYMYLLGNTYYVLKGKQTESDMLKSENLELTYNKQLFRRQYLQML